MTTSRVDVSDDYLLFDLMERELFTAVLCDVMDSMGYRNQAMSEVIRPLDPAFVFAMLWTRWATETRPCLR